MTRWDPARAPRPVVVQKRRRLLNPMVVGATQVLPAANVLTRCLCKTRVLDRRDDKAAHIIRAHGIVAPSDDTIAEWFR